MAPLATSSSKPVALVLAPSRGAVSGISTHVNLLLGSDLTKEFTLLHFQVGSEGRTRSFAVRWWSLLTSPVLLAACILRSGARIVHVNTAMNRRAFWRDLAYQLVAKLCGARVICQVHGGDLPRRFAASQRLPLRLMRALLSLPDVIVVIALHEYGAYRELLPDQEVVTLPNGIDFDPFLRDFPAARDRRGPLRLLYLGRLAREKGLDEALQGLALARAQGIAATLIVAGSGPDDARCRALASSLGLDDAVRFIGPVFDDDKYELLRTIDVLLLPSYAEGLPYALLESMAAGVPAIVTPVGGIPDVVADGVHGLFVPIRDAAAISRALVQLGHDRDLIAAMGCACRQRVVQFYTIERLTDDLGRLYRGICAGQNP